MRKLSSLLFTFGKRRLPLVDALHFLRSSAEIVRRYAPDKNHIPDEAEFVLLTQIINEAQDLRLAAMHAYYCFDE